MKFILTLILFLIGFYATSALSINIITVEVDGNDAEIFIDLDTNSPDAIQESDKLPAPDQKINIIVQINYQDNISSEITCSFYHDDGTNLASFISFYFVYDSITDTYRTTLGGYPARTFVSYYATCYDGQNTIRTPSVGYTLIIWDAPVSDGGTAGGGGRGLIEQSYYFVQEFSMPLIVLNILVLLLVLTKVDNKLNRGKKDI